MTEIVVLTADVSCLLIADCLTLPWPFAHMQSLILTTTL